MNGQGAAARPRRADGAAVPSGRAKIFRAATFAMSGLAVVALVVGLWLAFVNRHLDPNTVVPKPASAFWWSQALATLTFLLVALVMVRRPEIGWSVWAAAAALGHAVGLAAQGWAQRIFEAGRDLPGGDLAVWLLLWVLPIEVLAGNWMLMTAPDGKLPSRRWRRALAWLAMAMAGAGVLAGVVTRVDFAGNPFEGARFPFGRGLDLPEMLPFALLAPTIVPVLVLVVVRWRESTGDERRSMRTVLAILLAGPVVTPLVGFDPGLSIGVGQWMTILQMLALVGLVLRDRLFGIDTVLERALRTSLLVGLLLVVYAAIVALGDRVFHASLGPLGAVAVALLALPLRERLGAAVVRFLYGDRDRPERVVHAVARAATASASEHGMVEAALADVATGLRLPWMAIVVPGRDAPLAAFETMPDGVDQTSVDLVHRGRTVGVLRAGPRAGEDRIGERDVAALEEVAPHLAALVDAARSSVLLRDSRDRPVRVREEERRRLRRDLHDGLGPVLTGVALMTDVAQNRLASDPAGASEALTQTRVELSRAIDEIRRLVDELRPPVLDELGLVGAITEQCQRFGGLSVRVAHEGELGDLPAAVEVAAYRIALEAVTNVARHAAASSVVVRLCRGDDLEIEVADDGAGEDGWVPGVGITSMTDRATEIGGSLQAGPAPAGGGLVSAWLPVLT